MGFWNIPKLLRLAHTRAVGVFRVDQISRLAPGERSIALREVGSDEYPRPESPSYLNVSANDSEGGDSLVKDIDSLEIGDRVEVKIVVTKLEPEQSFENMVESIGRTV